MLQVFLALLWNSVRQLWLHYLSGSRSTTCDTRVVVEEEPESTRNILSLVVLSGLSTLNLIERRSQKRKLVCF